MNYQKKKLNQKQLISIYEKLVRPRIIEEKMLVLLRQGKISKWFSGIGQEAIAVGSTLALNKSEYILPMHRNLGVFTAREVPFSRLFSQFQGTMSGFTKGRDRSFHFGSNEHHIVGMISHLGPQLSIADGIALASKLSSKNEATLVFSGDGGASEGDFHEALNVAAVWDLPVIFVIENNGYGLSTPNSEQFKCINFVDKGPGYGIDAVKIDGNNILEVYHTISELAEDIRKNPRPVLVEAMTFRMRGHEEASGTKYVPKELMDEWAAKDPIENFEKFLIEKKVLSQKKISEIRANIKKEIETSLKEAYKDIPPSISSENELSDVYAGHDFKQIPIDKNEEREIRFIDAISEGLKQSMENHDNLVLMGQDIAEYGGVFKITEGFVDQFGKERVRNTPLCESAIIGSALGLSIKGYKSMVEMQFADFVSCGFNQIVNNLAKIHYRWGQNADVVVRMPTGAGVGAGPFHSQSNEAWFTHTPGLKVVYPSNPEDAKGLLISAINDPNPCMYFEHKYLYRSLKGNVPSGYYNIPLGKASVSREGTDLTVITYGLGVHWALQLASDTGYDIEVIDLRTLIPWDKETVYESIKKTGKALILHEDTQTGGFGGEIAAWISENCFELLDGPVYRVGSLDTPVPFNKDLENNFLAISQLHNKVTELIEY
ncbi:dehydrogenase E1 component subunit alpha/beta [Mangrovivirga sp. M17]|uniref:Dehydrogenase E1 component subunit alpha/beta n=1 Tax=Mangrovivirga halotolerans TaxID=2993936 RepID=A0ABT3RTW8_9BACT|nr:dehydrogenase E1 component subunit alpha/beta [Mangrovivirga halotolerans]MCX2744697.1 dehydrogenase E1 component subunit alpha/beta [Mangrovivirga halotolerans]